MARDFAKELREARDKENGEIRRLLARKEALAKEVAVTIRSTQVRKAGVAARAAGIQRVPPEWVMKNVQPDPETGEYDPAAIRSWAEKHRLVPTKEDQTPRSVGSAPVPEVPLRSFKEEREILKSSKFTG